MASDVSNRLCCSYAVLVMLGEERQSRLNTWTELHAMGRLCGSVAKVYSSLLLINVSRQSMYQFDAFIRLY